MATAPDFSVGAGGGAFQTGSRGALVPSGPRDLAIVREVSRAMVQYTNTQARGFTLVGGPQDQKDVLKYIRQLAGDERESLTIQRRLAGPAARMALPGMPSRLLLGGPPSSTGYGAGPSAAQMAAAMNARQQTIFMGGSGPTINMGAGANWTRAPGPNINIPPAPGGYGPTRPAYPPFPTGGGGGGGGGRGGRRGGGRGGGSGGGGYSGSFPQPHAGIYAGFRHGAGHLGFGPLANLAELGVVGSTVALGIAGPQIAAMISNAAFSGGDEARNYYLSAYDLGAAGGFSGQALGDYLRLSNGNSNSTLSAMRRSGMGPQEAMKILGQIGPIGGVGRSAAFIEDIANLRTTGAFSGMDTGDLVGYARSMRTLGVTPQAGTYAGVTAQSAGGANLVAIAKIMEEAVTLGLDRAEVLKSIDSGIQSSARGAIGVNASGIQNYLDQFLHTGLPGARTGQMGLDALAGSQAAVDALGSTPSSAMMMYKAMRQPLSSILTPDEMATITATPGGQAMLADYERERTTNPAAAAALFRPLLKAAGQGAMNRLSAGFASGLGFDPTTSRIIGFGVNGQGIVANYARYGGPADVPPIPQNGSGNFQSAGPDNGAAALKAMGVPENQVGMIIAAAKKYNLDPRILAAKYGNESGFGRNSSTSSAGAMGPMQFLPGTWSDMGGGDPQDLATAFDHGARLLAQGIQQYSGRPDAVYRSMRAYHDGPGRALASPIPGTETDISAHWDAYYLAKGGYAGDVLGRPWRHKAGVSIGPAPMEPGRTTDFAAIFSKFETSLTGSTASMREFSGAVDKFAQYVNQIGGYVSGAAPVSGHTATSDVGSVGKFLHAEADYLRSLMTRSATPAPHNPRGSFMSPTAPPAMDLPPPSYN